MTEDPSFSPECSPDTAAQDLAWMGRVKEGDMDAFRELIEAHQYRVIGTVAKMLGDDSEAEDLAQQVFIRVWRSAPRYEPTAKFTTWLYTITRNLVFNELRRRKRHATQSLTEAGAEEDRQPLQVADPSSKAPDTTVLDAEMQDAIQSAIDELPEVQRMAVILRRYDEVSYEEIGSILKLSVSAVKSVLFRARSELREKLKKYLAG
jgi:RNA polymerase sigma-70 factor (ECF subfamily)